RSAPVGCQRGRVQMDQSQGHDAHGHPAPGEEDGDEVACLISAFNDLASASSATSKLDGLMDLERLDDPRIVPFLVGVLADETQPMEVRIHLIRRLRNGRLAPDERVLVATLLCRLLHRDGQLDLRLQTALALGEFTDVDGVLAALGTIALAADE